MKILVIGHDLGTTLFSMGGSISAFRKKGDEIKVLSIIDNNVSDKVQLSMSYEETAEILGVDHDCLFTQGPITDRSDLRNVLMDKIREFDPELLIVPSPDSHDVNDRNLHSVAFGSSYSACVPNYPSINGFQATKVRCPILRMDFGDVGMNKSLQYVDISDHWEQKKRAIESLFSAPTNQSVGRLMVEAEIVARARGVQVQREFAEAFEIENVWGRLSVTRLLP